ncbi:FadR/GntR family transcriptional regulator [Humidisolicoccus flavus]|uniref:FadR/GntR family transcriptional regulator n=1 Tax=Humidisolicoccus flavus TaxID=3111414 RepID=UPI00324A2BE5
MSNTHEATELEPGAADASQHQFLSTMLKDRALADLVHLLLEKEPGEQIPSERELSERLEISRTALRDRISRLESLGMIQRREREGTFYTGISPERVSDGLVLSLMSHQMDIESLAEVRHALERHAAVLACGSRNDAAVRGMAESVDRMNASDDGRELFEADNAFHRHLFAASSAAGLLFFSQMLHSVLRGTLRFVTLAEERDRLRVVHTAVLDAVRNSDPESAGRAVDDHFDWLRHLIEKEREAGGSGPAWIPSAAHKDDVPK